MNWYLVKWIPGTRYTRAGYYVCKRYRDGEELREDIVDGPFSREQAEYNVEVIGGI